MITAIRCMILSSLLVVASAWAQPLTALAPADTIFSLGWQSQANPLDTLAADFADLDWSKARDTIYQLLDAAYEVTYDSDALQLLEGISLFLEAMETPDVMLSELYNICPATEGVVTSFRDYEGALEIDALLTVGVNSFNPLPAVTAIARSDAGPVSEIFADLQQALLGCTAAMMGEDLTQLEQDGVPLYVLADGSDFPLVLAVSADTYVISSNPEAVRGVIRRLMGSDEASFAERPVAQQQADRLASEGFSLTLDFSAIAEVLAAFTEMVPDDPAVNVLVDRGLRFLSTLGSFAGTLYSTEEGLAFESLLAVNTDGGDELLAEMLTCSSCTVSAANLIPADSLTVASQYLPLRDIISYIEDVLAEVAEASGESIDFRAFLRDNLDFDIDVALLNWLGTEFHTATLAAPLSLDLRDLLYGADTVTIIPVSSQVAARAGFNEISRTLQDNLPLLLELLGEFDDLQGFNVITDSVAVRDYDYEGVSITRYQFSFNGEITTALVDNNLVIGNSLDAIIAVIDTALHGDGIATDSNYSAFLERIPEAVGAVSFSYDQASVYALAEILDLATQPAAFALSTALQAGLSDFGNDFVGYADLYNVVPESLSPGEISASLAAPGSEEASSEESVPLNNDSGSDYYLLEGLSPGNLVTIELTSSDFDTYLYLIDASSEAYLDDNDDSPDTTRSEISFIVAEDQSYWLQVSSFDGLGGDYQLTISSVEAEEGAENAVGFDRGYAFLGSAVPQPLGLTEGYSSTLVASSDSGSVDYVSIADYYALEGLNPGDRVTVTLSSDDFDAYLYLIDADFESYLAENDGPYDSNSTEISFVAEAGINYLVQVSSYFGDETGDYQLSYSIVDDVALEAATTPPGFSELLETVELLPESLRVLGDHLSTSESYTVVDGNVIYSYSLTRLRW